MRRWVKSVGTVVIAGIMLIGGTILSGGIHSAEPVYAAGESDSLRNTVSVVGTGEISVKPDVAYLSIGVETQAPTAKEAQSANADKMTKINTVLKNTWKIADKDIKTGQFYVQPNYTYNEKEGQKVTGYSAHHTLEVTYRDLDKVGQLLDAVSSAGANRVNNVRFSTENPDQYQEQVIQKAMANADMKASAIAKAAKRQLGVVINVVQSGGGSSPIYPMAYAKAEMAADSASTPIEPGEINLQTTLSVIYELK